MTGRPKNVKIGNLPGLPFVDGECQTKKMAFTCYDLPSLVTTPFVLYDISRLLRRAQGMAPTGIDRIDLQVARALLDVFGNRFLPVVRQGAMADVPDPRLTAALLKNLWALWKGDESKRDDVRRLARALDRKWIRLRSRHWPVRRIRALTEGKKVTYICCSHSGLLTSGDFLVWLGKALSFKAFVYIHDLIPLDYPEFSRPSAIPRFRRMLETAMHLNPYYIVNSEYTKARLDEWLHQNGSPEAADRILVAQPVIDWLPDLSKIEAKHEGDVPYFVIVGTIEPRKNHLLLLHIWREWALQGNKSIPHLHIIGKRGWENQTVFNFLDRCQVIRPFVHEHGCLNQYEAFSYLLGAKALLMPSFVEGLGLPVLEAIQMGKKVIVSDIPAFKSLKGGGADSIVRIAPMDEINWRKAIVQATGNCL